MDSSSWPMPSGTVTFLFTDIEGSTRQWEQHPQDMQAALVRHDAILNPDNIQLELSAAYR